MRLQEMKSKIISKRERSLHQQSRNLEQMRITADQARLSCNMQKQAGYEMLFKEKSDDIVRKSKKASLIYNERQEANMWKRHERSINYEQSAVKAHEETVKATQEKDQTEKVIKKLESEETRLIAHIG